MTSTLVDSNVFLDLFGGGSFADWSQKTLRSCFAEGELVLSPIVWAEICQTVTSVSRLNNSLNLLSPRKEKLDFEIAERAGKAHVAYQSAGGSRERTLPDFLIGAHAEICNYTILTRDPNRYRSYFPLVDIIAPDTHP